MLINLTPNQVEIERRQRIAKENNFEYIPQCDACFMQYGKGFYQSSVPFNFAYDEFLEFDIEKKIFNIPFEQAFESFAPDYKKIQYGIADSVEQIKEYYKEEIEDLNKKYFIAATPVFQDKSQKGKRGGWRWHKWGVYIGTLNPQCEYLDDEDFGENFKYVICFRLYELK